MLWNYKAEDKTAEMSAGTVRSISTSTATVGHERALYRRQTPTAPWALSPRKPSTRRRSPPFPPMSPRFSTPGNWRSSTRFDVLLLNMPCFVAFAVWDRLVDFFEAGGPFMGALGGVRAGGGRGDDPCAGGRCGANGCCRVSCARDRKAARRHRHRAHLATVEENPAALARIRPGGALATWNFPARKTRGWCRRPPGARSCVWRAAWGCWN